MGFFKNLFNQAVEIDRLNRHCDFLVAQLERESEFRDLTEKQLIAERKAKDKVMLRYCDQISQKAGLFGHFSKDAEKDDKKDDPPEFISKFDAEKIEWAAQEMRDADIKSDIEPRPLERYIEIISQDPSRYILN